MKITCQELKAVSNQNDVQATLSDVQKVEIESPIEIDAIIKAISPGALLEHIGMETVLKHFGIRPLKLNIRNQINGGPSIDFCIGEQEIVLKYDENQVVELTEDVNMYLDVVK